MDLMENYPFKDKDFAFVALYASMFEKEPRKFKK
jgi:hypothetical protein